MQGAAQGRTDPQSPKGNNLHGDLVPATAVLAQGNSLLTTNLVALHHFFPPGCNDSNSHPPAPELLLGQMVHQFNVSAAHKAQRGECTSSARPPFWIQMSVYQLAR